MFRGLASQHDAKHFGVRMTAKTFRALVILLPLLRHFERSEKSSYFSYHNTRLYWILRAFSPQDDAIKNEPSCLPYLLLCIFLLMEQKSYTYILFSERNGTLYVGVTNNIIRRVTEHKEKQIPGFTQQYGVDKLGYFEEYNDIRLAIQREKELKGWNRKKKIALIESINPHWNDLFYELQ